MAVKKSAVAAGKLDPESFVQIQKLSESSDIIAVGDFCVVVGPGADPDSYEVRKYDAEEDGPVGEKELVYLEEIRTATKEEADDASVHGGEEVYGGKEEPVSVKKTAKGKGSPAAETKAQTEVNTKTKAKSKKGGALKPAVAAKKVAAKAAKKTAVAKPVKEKLPAVVVPIKDTSSVLAALKGKDAVEAIKALESKQQITKWTLGGVLSRIKREKLFLTVGEGKAKKTYTDDLKGFQQFLEDNTDTSYRTAMSLIGVYEHFIPTGLAEDRLAAISYSKLNLISDLVTDEKSAESWVKKTESMTYEKLEAEVKKGREAAGIEVRPRGANAGKVDYITHKFKNHADEAKVIEKAMKKAKGKLEGTENLDNRAFYLIVSEWLQLSE